MSGQIYAAIVGALLLLCSSASAQQFEREPPPSGEARPAPYLPEPVSYIGLIDKPPRPGTAADTADQRSRLLTQYVSPARLATAELDEAFVFPRFEAAFGHAIDRQTTPRLVHLLDRALRDVAATTFAAKTYFNRPRPYQRFQLKHFCGGSPPQPDRPLDGGSSYPSGHASYGWITALILADIAPERRAEIAARASQYAESRVICGAHFETDIEAGRRIALGVFRALLADEVFQHDLTAAREEHDVARRTPESSEQRARTDQLHLQ